MKPIVHGLEKQYAGRIDFVYIDVSDPATQDLQSRLEFRGTPQFVFLDATGQPSGQAKYGVVAENELKAALDELASAGP
jgi:thioredoxin-related protein